MNSKILPLFLLTAILSLAMVSAADLTFTQSVDSQSFTSSLTGTLSVDTNIATTYSGVSTVIPTTVTFNVSEVKIDTTADYSKLNIGIHTGNLIITNSTDNETISAEFVKTFCSAGAQNDSELIIKKVKIRNNGPSEDGKDERWFPLDEISVEVELENDGSEEIEDIVFELGLFEKGSSTNIAEDMIWISEDDEEIELGDIEEAGEDDELTHTFEFKVNPDDLEDGNYILVIKAYEDGRESDICVDYSDELDDEDFGSSTYYADIEIDKESEKDNRAIVVDVDKLDFPIIATCDERRIIELDVWNIADVDQEQVKVNIYNQELGIDMDYIIREDLDQGERARVEFDLIIPDDAEEKLYDLILRTYYDYDDDDETYDEYSDTFKAFLKIEGNCKIDSKAQITAELDTETPNAIAGKQVIIKATVKNTGDEEIIYDISVSGNSAWSSLTEINPKTITIAAGGSKEVSITLDIDADTEGEKEFTIKASVDGESVKEQKVAFSVTKRTSKINSSAITEHVKANGFIYAIVIINLILIIAIISVVRRMVGTTTPIA